MKQWIIVGLLLIAPSLSDAQDKEFVLHLDGIVAKKLKPDMRVRIWALKGSEERQSLHRTHSVADFPQKLDWKTFHDRSLIVEFYDAKTLLFSLELSRDLFNAPRPIRLNLDAPKPVIKPVFSILSDIRYTGNLSRRIHYRDLPRIDRKSGQLMSPFKPLIKITKLKSGETKLVKCTEGCFGYYWWARLPFKNPPSGTKFKFSVTYDSGGLFETIETTREFKFVQNDY